MELSLNSDVVQQKSKKVATKKRVETPDLTQNPDHSLRRSGLNPILLRFGVLHIR
jgi:hypothetical protein